MLAAGGLAASVAYACTPGGTVSVTTNTLTPGATVRVEASGFARDAANLEAAKRHSPVRLTWNAVNGVLLGEMPAPTEVTLATGSTRLVWAMDVTIPASATPSDDFYAIVGSQTKASGDLYLTGSVQVWVVPPRSGSSDPNPGTTPMTPSPASITPTPAGGVAVKAPAPGAATIAPPTGPAVPAAAAAARAADPTAPTLRAPAPAAPVELVDPTKPIPVPEADDIWSGLGASGPGLLDTPVTAPQRGAAPGAILLGMGVLGLAGAAVVAHQTRRATARATVR